MPYTLQQALDKAAVHMLAQGKRAESLEPKTYGCQYLMEVGGEVLMCGVGCLIPRDKYTPDIEGIPAPDLYHEEQWFRELFDVNETEDLLLFLGQLQAVHDGVPPDQWPNALRRVAARFNLTYNLDGAFV